MDDSRNVGVQFTRLPTPKRSDPPASPERERWRAGGGQVEPAGKLPNRKEIRNVGVQFTRPPRLSPPQADDGGQVEPRKAGLDLPANASLGIIFRQSK